MIFRSHFLTLHIFSLMSLSIQFEGGYFIDFSGIRIQNATSSVRMLSGGNLRCCLMCLNNNGCHGVNFHNQDGICEINTLGPDGYGDIVDTDQAWTVYFRSNSK
jgi:hypothetical protein